VVEAMELFGTVACYLGVQAGSRPGREGGGGVLLFLSSSSQGSSLVVPTTALSIAVDTTGGHCNAYYGRPELREQEKEEETQQAVVKQRQNRLKAALAILGPIGMGIGAMSSLGWLDWPRPRLALPRSASLKHPLVSLFHPGPSPLFCPPSSPTLHRPHVSRTVLMKPSQHPTLDLV
jgi:hypothetical protein